MAQLHNKTEAVDKPCGFLSIDYYGHRLVSATIDTWQINAKQTGEWYACVAGEQVERTINTGQKVYAQFLAGNGHCYLGQGTIITTRISDDSNYVSSSTTKPVATFLAEGSLTYIVLSGPLKGTKGNI